jgi:hypothetical protein
MDSDKLRELFPSQSAEVRRLAMLLAQQVHAMKADGAELFPCVDGQYYRVGIDEVDAPSPPPDPPA